MLQDALVVKMRPANGATPGATPQDLLRGTPVEDVAPLFDWPSRHATGPAAARSSRLAGVFRVSFHTPVDILALIRRLERDPNVEYAEPVLRARVDAVTNDPYLSSSGAWGQAYQDLWGLHKISAPAAWDRATGEGLLVAVVDTGSDPTHPDLAANLWQNPGEIAGNFLDDDGNGFVDDVRGWDFVSGDADPSDGHGHGTHVSGTIAAVAGNGTGVAGVAWSAKVMPLKGLGDDGYGFSDGLAEAIVYAAENGARVVNMSWGLIGFSRVVEDALALAYDLGVVLVASAGNDFGEAWAAHPAGSRFVLCIGASTPTDLRAQFSNFGTSLDVLAPGGADSSDGGGPNVLSLRSSALLPSLPAELLVGDRYLRLQGTSMAAPHVAGLAALLLEEQPGLTPEEIRQALRRSAVDVSTPGWDRDSGFGRVSATAALDGSGVRGSARILSPRAREVLTSPQTDILGTATAPAFASYTLDYAPGVSPAEWAPLVSSTSPVGRGRLATWDISELTDEIYTLRLTVLDTGGRRFEDRLEIVVDNVRIASPAPDSIFRGGDPVTFTGSSRASDFSHYRLEYLDPATVTWKSDGMTLPGGGLTPVVGGMLGTWDTSGLTRAGYYRVRLTAYRHDGTWEQEEITLLIDPFLHPGWPRTLPNRFEGGFSDAMEDNLTAADVDRDGTIELLFAQGDQVHVLRHDGTYLPGWPRQIPGFFVQSSPAAGDLDGDGKLELAVARLWVYIFRSDGTRIGPLETLGNHVAIGDVLGDSRPELIVSGIAEESGTPVWVLDANGNPLAPPYQAQRVDPGATRRPFLSRPVLTDLDGDGKLDIVVVNTFDLLEIHAFRGDGTPLPGFPRSLGLQLPFSYYPFFHPVAADIDGDSWPEIVIGDSGCRMVAVSRTGQILPGWPFEPAEQLSHCGSASLSDLDGDGAAEIVVGAQRLVDGNAVLFVLNAQGQALPGWPLRWSSTHSYYGAGEAALVDVDGDGARELVVDGNDTYPYSYSLRAFKRQGGLVPGFPFPTYWVGAWPTNTPAVLDLDADGLLEIAWLNALGQIFVWDLDVPARVTAQDWPMFRHDAGHTGAVPSARWCSVAPEALDFHTVTPCRVLDTRSATGPRGGPALSSGVSRLLPVTGSCGIPPTARAVAINVTVTGPTAPGYLSFTPGGCSTAPRTGTLTFAAGATRSNLAILPLSTNGTGAVTVFPALFPAFTPGNVHLVLDVTGYFE